MPLCTLREARPTGRAAFSTCAVSLFALFAVACSSGGVLDAGGGFDAGSGFDAGDTTDAGVDAGSSDAGPIDAATTRDAAMGTVCALGDRRICFDGEPSQAGVGVCRLGLQECTVDGEFARWAPCEGQRLPDAMEMCGNGFDDNCDGTVDEGCGCTAGASTSCYPGPMGTEGVGACRSGTSTCDAAGAAFGPCEGAVMPVTEACGDAVDNDCNGMADEGCGVCTPGAGTSCYTGPAGTGGVGTCRPGMQFCNSAGSAYGPCTGSVTPVSEVCGDGADNDCNRTVDNGCAPPPSECWGTPFTHELCRSVSTSGYGPGGCPWAICKATADPAGSACGGGNSSIDGRWEESCDTCSSPPCQMYRTTVQNCGSIHC